MNRVKGNLLLTGFMVMMLAASWSQAAPKSEVLEYGYYEFTGDAQRLSSAKATSGFVTRGDAQLVKQTERVPIESGRLFGFRFRFSGMNRNVGVMPLELIVEHPPMTKPDGTVSTGYRYFLQLPMKNGVVEDKTGYRLNEVYEQVEGEWRFIYRFMNKPILEQRFTTYKAKGKNE